MMDTTANSEDGGDGTTGVKRPAEGDPHAVSSAKVAALSSDTSNGQTNGSKSKDPYDGSELYSPTTAYANEVDDDGPPGVDDGPPGVEVRPPNVDDGPPGVDNGPPGVGVRPLNVDDGPPGVDDGPPGVDDGPPGVDDGPPGVEDGPPGVDDPTARQPSPIKKPPPGTTSPAAAAAAAAAAAEPVQVETSVEKNSTQTEATDGANQAAVATSSADSTKPEGQAISVRASSSLPMGMNSNQQQSQPYWQQNQQHNYYNNQQNWNQPPPSTWGGPSPGHWGAQPHTSGPAQYAQQFAQWQQSYNYGQGPHGSWQGNQGWNWNMQQNQGWNAQHQGWNQQGWNMQQQQQQQGYNQQQGAYYNWQQSQAYDNWQRQKQNEQQQQQQQQQKESFTPSTPTTQRNVIQVPLGSGTKNTLSSIPLPSGIPLPPASSSATSASAKSKPIISAKTKEEIAVQLLESKRSRKMADDKEPEQGPVEGPVQGPELPPRQEKSVPDPIVTPKHFCMGNLPEGTKAAAFRDMLAVFGKVTMCKVAAGKGANAGIFAFVTIECLTDASTLLSSLNGWEYNGIKLTAKKLKNPPGAKPKQEPKSS